MRGRCRPDPLKLAIARKKVVIVFDGGNLKEPKSICTYRTSVEGYRYIYDSLHGAKLVGIYRFKQQ